MLPARRSAMGIAKSDNDSSDLTPAGLDPTSLDRVRAMQARVVEQPQELHEHTARIERLRERLKQGAPDMAADATRRPVIDGKQLCRAKRRRCS
jgi:hypothetical protein